MSQKIRVVVYNGSVFLRATDVAEYVRRVAETEETDTRRRLIEAASILEHITPPILSNHV